MAMSSQVTLRGLLGLGDGPAPLQDSALQPRLPADGRGQRDRHRGLPVSGGTPVPATTLQTATLAGIADLFAVVANTPDDLPG